MNKMWKSFKEWTGTSKLSSNQELNRSQYSIVSSGELTADTIQLWLGLPEEVKYDPALAPFRQFYEKEHGKLENVAQNTKTKCLPLVNSTPHLSNNLQVVTEEIEFSEKNQKKDEDNHVKEKERMYNNTLGEGSKSQFSRAKYYIKMTVLLACWVFFTAIFMLYNEKHEEVMTTSVAPGELKDYILHISNKELVVQVTLSGPFLTQQAERKCNLSQLNGPKMEAWVERWTLKGDEVGNFIADADIIDREKTEIYNILLQDDAKLDFNLGEPRSTIFRLGPSTGNLTKAYSIRMKTTSNKTIPYTLSYTLDPLDISSGVVYAMLLLCGLYILIIFEVIHRTMAAVLVSTMSLAVLSLVGERPSLQEIVSWLDVETLLLLFSMMLLVAIMAETGIFDYLAVFTFEVTKGKLWPLIFLLCSITGVLSTFLDNVTTVLLMSPVTIRLCEVMDLDPIPILMFMTIYSNIGGTATPVGDPPNVIVASNKSVINAGINFTNFTAHMALGIVLIFIQTTVHIRFMYRDTNKLRVKVPRDIQELRHQISIWRRAVDSLPHLSKGVHVVRERLERKISKLSAELEILIKQSHKRACPKETFHSTLNELKEKHKIRDKVLLVKASISIVFVVIVFFLHSVPELNRVSLGWTALLGALLLLVLADREDLEPVLHRVEWSTLLFFAALFVLMEALSKLGLILYVGGIMESIILKVDEGGRLAVAIMLVIWVSGVFSAFVDNIPLTTMMVRVVISIGTNPNLNLPLSPLIWALLYGACLGGNGTLIGASANVVCAGVAEQHGYKFTFMQFFRVGFPIMVGHLIVASGYLLLCHCVFAWH